MIPLGLWPRYAAFWVPGCPPRGNPEDADCVFGLAFGRNSIPDSDLWRVGAEWEQHWLFDDWSTRHALLKRRFDPGQANVSLAHDAVWYAEKYNIPRLILQWEIYVALPTEWFQKHPGRASAIWPPAHFVKYWNSRDVATEGLEMMKRRGFRFRRPALLMHKWHALRSYLLVRPILGKNLIVLPQGTECFDPKSVQPHTTSREEWLKRDWLARGHHIVNGLV